LSSPSIQSSMKGILIKDNAIEAIGTPFPQCRRFNPAHSEARDKGENRRFGCCHVGGTLCLNPTLEGGGRLTSGNQVPVIGGGGQLSVGSSRPGCWIITDEGGHSIDDLDLT
jgi:hypothetical protein